MGDRRWGPHQDRWDGHRFNFAMFVLGVAGSLLLSFGWGDLTSSHSWLVSTDVWATTQSSQYVTWGGFGAVYGANPWFCALPGFLLLMAPVVALGDHLGLVTGYPIALPHPSMWLLLGPFFSLISAGLVFGVDYLAWTLGISRIRRRLTALGTAIFVVIPTPGVAGHPEDLLALTLVCFALAHLIQHRPTRAAWMLCAAILFQTWAGLLIPVLIVASPVASRLGNLLRSSLIPSVLGLALLAFDYSDASLDLLRQPVPDHGQRLPWHEIASRVRVDDSGHAVLMAAGSSTRWMAVVVSLVAAWAIRRRIGPRSVMLAASLALFARDFFETTYWPYYVAPAAVLMTLSVVMSTPGNWRRAGVGVSAAFLMYASAPLAYLGIGYNPFQALAVLAVTALVVVGVTRPFRLGRQGQRGALADPIEVGSTALLSVAS